MVTGQWYVCFVVCLLCTVRIYHGDTDVYWQHQETRETVNLFIQGREEKGLAHDREVFTQVSRDAGPFKF